jgi:hypothetical protein
MNKFKLLSLVSGLTVALNLVPSVFAQAVQNHVRIVGTTRTVWFGDVTNNGCTVTDTDGKEHSLSEPMAICALDAASKTGGFTYTVKDFGGSLGLFLESIAEDKPAADFSTYWLYDINGTGASVGAASYKTNNGDSLYFHFENPGADKAKRAVNDGLSYLKSQQQSSGQIAGFNGVSDWAAMAFAGEDIDISDISKGGISLMDYLKTNPPGPSASATEWERAILAISAAGQNPFSFGGRNYVQTLEAMANNSQIGDANLLNDDMFGLLALISVGNSSNLQIKQDSLNFLVANQSQGGGFGWSKTSGPDIDTTAAAIQALKAGKNAGLSNSNLDQSISNAKFYLLSGQNPDGGFGYLPGEPSNGSTTAWALLALSSLGENGESVQKAKEYLVKNQEENGSFKWQNGFSGDTFTSSYAITALSGKYWPVKTYAGSAPSPSIAPSPSPSISPSPSPSPSPTPVPSPSANPSPSTAPSASPVPSASPSPAASPSPSPSTSPKPGIKLGEIFKKQQERMEELRRKQQARMEEIRKKMDERMKKLSDKLNGLFR